MRLYYLHLMSSWQVLIFTVDFIVSILLTVAMHFLEETQSAS